MCRDDSVCSVTVPIEPRSVRLARAHFREWLEFLDWPQTSRDDLVLAVNEAVTNAVEHSGDVPDSVGAVEQVVDVAAEVELTGQGRRLRIWVRDHGRWREPASDPGSRGLGLALMAELTDQMLINRGEIGTEVMLVSTAA